MIFKDIIIPLQYWKCLSWARERHFSRLSICLKNDNETLYIWYYYTLIIKLDCWNVLHSRKPYYRPPTASSKSFGRSNPTHAWCSTWRWRKSCKVLGAQAWPQTDGIPQWPPHWTMPAWAWGHTVCRTNGWGTIGWKAVINEYIARTRDRFQEKLWRQSIKHHAVSDVTVYRFYRFISVKSKPILSPDPFSHFSWWTFKTTYSDHHRYIANSVSHNCWISSTDRTL